MNLLRPADTAGAAVTVSSGQDVSGNSSAGLPPPRFTLRAIFWTVAGVAVALSVWQAVGPTMGLMLLLILIIVGAHVAGNAIGSRLRDRGTQHALAAWRDAATDGEGTSRGVSREIQPHHFAPVTRLSRRTSLGWFPVVVTIIGGIVGAVGGGLALQRMNPAAATVSTIALGALATGVLAALWSFWMFSLLQVFLGAWWQADRHSHRR